MTTDSSGDRRLPPLPDLVAGGLFLLGVLLWMLVGKEFIFVAALGAFGPGVVRELGWLRDEDEFQRQAAHRAGYHAYVVGGLATAAATGALHWTDGDPRFPAELLTWVLVLMWLTWLLSAMLAYWGARRTTRIVLGTFGAFWALFILADLVSEPASSVQRLQGMAAGLAILTPFFGLAYLAGRRPRISGGLLLLTAVGFTMVFFPAGSPLAISTRLMTFTTLVLPLLACGIALVRDSTGDPAR